MDRSDEIAKGIVTSYDAGVARVPAVKRPRMAPTNRVISDFGSPRDRTVTLFELNNAICR
jgi:hypothetical protein